jgi:hypothetical protein
MLHLPRFKTKKHTPHAIALKAVEQTITLYGQLSQQNVFIDYGLMALIRTNVVCRFTTTVLAATEATNTKAKQLATCLFYCSSPGST